MWICSCHAVTDGMIKEFAKKHGCAWKKMTQELKVGTQCGTCAKSAKEILEQAAGKPKRKRTKRTRTDGANSQVASSKCAAASEVVADSEGAAASVVVADSQVDVTPTKDVTSASAASTPSAPAASTSAFLPCGKCVCSCGK